MYRKISALLPFDECALVAHTARPSAVIPYTAMYNALSLQLTAGLYALACTSYGVHGGVLSSPTFITSSRSIRSQDGSDCRLSLHDTTPGEQMPFYSQQQPPQITIYHTSFYRPRCLSSSAYASLHMLMLLAAPVRAHAHNAQALSSTQPVMAPLQTVSLACCAKAVRSSPALHLQRRHASVSHHSNSTSSHTHTHPSPSTASEETMHARAMEHKDGCETSTLGSGSRRRSNSDSRAAHARDGAPAEESCTRGRFGTAESTTPHEDDDKTPPHEDRSSSTFPEVVEACCVLKLISDTGVVQSNWSSADVLQAAYHDLVRQYHPDMHGGDTAIMTRVNAAYARLRRLSPYERCAYANELRSRNRRDIVALSLRQCADDDGRVGCAHDGYDAHYDGSDGKPVSCFRYTCYTNNMMSSSAMDMVRLMLGSSCTTLLCAMLWLVWSSVYEYVVGTDKHKITTRV